MNASTDQDRGGGRGLSLTPEPDLRARPLRLAVIGSPRSGNTWIRGLLACLYDLEEFAINRPEELDWAALPSRCIIQIHQYPHPDFDALIARSGVRVVSPARHPLDVMISALNYAQHTPEAPRWTAATGERWTLRGATPLSREFIEYSKNAEPGAVLSFSPAWWGRDGVIRIRYEDLVRDPAGVLSGAAAQVDRNIARPVEFVVSQFSIDARRADPAVWHYHFGLGRPGIWRQLLPEARASAIAECHRPAFELLGYACDPDPGLDDLAAERNWYRLRAALLERHLDDERRRREATQKAIRDLQGRATTPGTPHLRAHASSAARAMTRRVRSGLRRLLPSR